VLPVAALALRFANECARVWSAGANDGKKKATHLKVNGWSVCRGVFERTYRHAPGL